MNRAPYKILENTRTCTDKEYYPWVLVDKFSDEVFLFHEKSTGEMVRDFLNGGDKTREILDVVFQYGDKVLIDMISRVLEKYES